MLVVDPSVLSRQDTLQTYYAAAYALYPRRVFLSGAIDPPAEAVERRVHRIIFVGRISPFHAAAVERVSELLTLVNLQ